VGGDYGNPSRPVTAIGVPSARPAR
jgi:hypothetical protein